MHDGLTAVSFDMLVFFSAVLSHYSEAKHNVSVLLMYRLLLFFFFKKKMVSGTQLRFCRRKLILQFCSSCLWLAGLLLPADKDVSASRRSQSGRGLGKMGSVGQDADHATVIFLMDLRTGTCGSQVWLWRGRGVCPIS